MMFLQCLSEKYSAYVNLFATFSLLHLLVLNIYLHPYQSQYFNIFAKYMYGQDIYRTQRTSISTGSYFYKAYQIIAKKYLSKFPKDKKVVIISNSPPAEINRVLLDNELSARFKVYGSREISKDLKLEFNTCLEKFLTVYGKENEGATFTYDNSNNSLQVWGNLNLFPKDRIAECYSDSQTLERLDEFYKNGQFTQGYKKVGRLLFDEGDFYVGPYERPGLDTLETINVDKRPVMYIQKINPYRPYIL